MVHICTYISEYEVSIRFRIVSVPKGNLSIVSIENECVVRVWFFLILL